MSLKALADTGWLQVVVDEDIHRHKAGWWKRSDLSHSSVVDCYRKDADSVTVWAQVDFLGALI